jgi:drug/metabolite transporter (DMT)-like permease
VTRGYLTLLVTLAALWGSSYLFIKVAVEEIEPAAMIVFRLLLAALILLAVLLAQRGVRRALADVRATGHHGVVLGIVNASIPFWLIAWGEKYVDSGVAAIANSTVPIFVVLLAIRLHPAERSSGQRLAGILVGLVGVGVLTGVPSRGRMVGRRRHARSRRLVRLLRVLEPLHTGPVYRHAAARHRDGGDLGRRGRHASLRAGTAAL